MYSFTMETLVIVDAIAFRCLCSFFVSRRQILRLRDILSQLC